jgi:hypothetical protein
VPQKCSGYCLRPKVVVEVEEGEEEKSASSLTHLSEFGKRQLRRRLHCRDVRYGLETWDE